MNFQNPIHAKIYEKVVAPTLNTIRHDVDGVIVAVDIEASTVDVHWKDPKGQISRVAEQLKMPRSVSGVFGQSLQVGDKVQIAFRHSDIGFPYITTTYDYSSSRNHLLTEYGARLPKGLSSL